MIARYFDNSSLGGRNAQLVAQANADHQRADLVKPIRPPPKYPKRQVQLPRRRHNSI
jgi:hypothetical protein